MGGGGGGDILNRNLLQKWDKFRAVDVFYYKVGGEYLDSMESCVR